MMTSGKKESLFQEKAIQLIRSKGGYVVKTHVSAYQSQGEPDLIVCYLGRFIAFELKVKGNKASRLQQEKIKEIQRAGGNAITTYSLEEIEETLNEIRRLQCDTESQ